MRAKLLLWLWVLTDLLLFVGAYALAYFLRVGFILSSDFPINQFLAAAITVAPLWLIVLATTRTFHLTRNQKTARNAAYIFYASAVGVALFTLAYYFTFEAFFSRLLLVYAFAFSFLIIWAWHIVYQSIHRKLLRKDPPVFPTLIVGVTRESTALIETLNKKMSPLKPVAILDGRGAKVEEIDGVPVRGKLNKLEEVLNEGITHLIQCSDLEQSLNLLSACRQKGITYMLLPSALGIIERDEKVDTVEGMQVTVVGPKKGPMGWLFG